MSCVVFVGLPRSGLVPKRTLISKKAGPLVLSSFFIAFLISYFVEAYPHQLYPHDFANLTQSTLSPAFG